VFLDGVRRVGGGLGGFGGDGGPVAFDRGRHRGARHANVHAAARAFARWSNEDEGWIPRGGGIHERERAWKPRIRDEFGVGAERERGWTVLVQVPGPVAVDDDRGV
jgi:hypothetical protein